MKVGARCQTPRAILLTKEMKMYRPECLNPFPEDLADSLMDMALERMGIAKERLANLSDEEKRRLDEVTWRLVTAADVSEEACCD